MHYAKKSLWTLCLFILTLSCGRPALGQLIALEDFESYPVGELNGQNGGTGWAGAWTADETYIEVVQPSPSLTYAVAEGTIDGGSRALQVVGGATVDNVFFREFGTALTEDVVYVAFLFRFDAGAIGNNDFASFWYDNVTTGAHQNNPSIGLKGNQGSGGGPEDLVARIQQNTNAVYSTSVAVGTTYYVIGRLRKEPAGAANNYSRFDLWVNPSVADSTSPDVTSSDPGLLSSLPFIGLRSVNLLADDVVLFDGIAHGGFWADVFAKRFSASLPVELAAFEATPDGRAVTLQWATAGETNNAGFEVQHRQEEGEGRFERVAYVEGAGTTTVPQTYTHRLDNLIPGHHAFRLKQIDLDGTATYSPDVEVAVELPSAYLIEPIYPNPFHASATLRFGVQQTQQVEVAVYDVLGRRVQTLFDGVAEMGRIETLTLDGGRLPSGTYLVRVSGEHVRTAQRVMLLK